MIERSAPASARLEGLRSDAAANRRRVVEAAATAVRREGEKVPIATIAKDAGVGVGTVYRHFPTRSALLAAISHRSFRIALDHARTAAESTEDPLRALAAFFELTIKNRRDLVLPLHGGPVVNDAETAALRAEIREILGGVLRRGQRDGTLRGDIAPLDIIIAASLISLPLPHVADWSAVARRQASIYLAGLAAPTEPM